MSRSLSGHCDICGADVGELCRDSCTNVTEQLNSVSAAAQAHREATGRGFGDPVALTEERKSTHGDWLHQSAIGVSLDQVLQAGQGYASLHPYQRKAVDMIAVKLSRIVAGDPDHDDHWDDIAGYAHLGKGGHKS